MVNNMYNQRKELLMDSKNRLTNKLQKWTQIKSRKFRILAENKKTNQSPTFKMYKKNKIELNFKDYFIKTQNTLINFL